MFTKPVKTDVHKHLEMLQKRMTLSMEQRTLLDRLSAGHRGELQFFRLLQNELQCDPIQLFDMHLKMNGSECQIDSLLIFQNELLLFEIKNYQGDFLIENSKWYTISKEEIKNPLYQLQRTELLLKQLLKESQIPLNIRSYLVFVHPEFQLYQAPVQLPIVFPTQLKRFIRKLQNTSSTIHQHHHDIASFLKSKHLNSSAYESRLAYDYANLQKGMTCGKCNSFMKLHSKKYMRCTGCECMESFKIALLRNIDEFQTLFPQQHITVNKIAEWTNYPVTAYRIRTIISKNYRLVNKGKNSYYVPTKPSHYDHN